MVQWWVLAITSGAFSTARDLFRKKGLEKEHAMEFALTRSILVTLLTLTLIPFLSFKYTFTLILLVYFISVIVTLGILLTTKSIRHAQISEVAPLHNLTPGFLAVLAFIFLGEVLTKAQVGGMVLLIVGAYILETDHGNLAKSFMKHIKSKYVDYAITAAFIFSVTALLDKYVIKNLIGPLDYFFLIWVFVSLNFIIISSIKHDGLKGVKHCFKISKQYVVLTAVFSFFSNLFYFLAIVTGLISLVMAIRKLSTLFTTIIGGELFHEGRLFRKSIACAVMIVGAILIIV